jgi:hypothetical protein
MPFLSEAQRKWMLKNKPAAALQLEGETPAGTKLPKRTEGGKARKKRERLYKKKPHR